MSSLISQKEITRTVIKNMGASGIEGLDSDLLTEKLLYFYDNNTPIPQRVNILMETFDIDRETATTIERVQFAKISLLSDYFINKDRGANKFDIVGERGVLKSNLPISDFVANIGFMITNNAYPEFYKR